jgi:hypothetical protein
MKDRKPKQRGGGMEYSPRFLDAILSAEERAAERESADHTQVCCCHKKGDTVTISGEQFTCASRILDAGCQLHGHLDPWTHYISVLQTDGRTPGKVKSV